jgi:hypothetical protein
MAEDLHTSEVMETKVCNACKQEKPFSEYYIRKETGQPKNRCKRCCIDGRNMQRSSTHKACKHCGEEKPFSEYQKAGGGAWLQPYCKPCDADRKRRHFEKNRDREMAKRKQHYEANKEEILQREKERRAAKPKPPKVPRPRMSEEERKRRKSECDRRYRERNADKVKQRKSEHYERIGREQRRVWGNRAMATNPYYRLARNIRTRIRCALKPSNAYKADRTEELLGCTISEFHAYFESLFTEGMTWELFMHGEIHIDHIIPCKLFDLTDPEQQKQCFSYRNLQPLWKVDNLKKGIKIINQIPTHDRQFRTTEPPHSGT